MTVAFLDLRGAAEGLERDIPAGGGRVVDDDDRDLRPEFGLRSGQGDTAGTEEACWQALWAALHLNRFVLRQTWQGVQVLAHAAGQPTIRLEDLRRRTMAALEEIGPAAPDRSLVEAARELLRERG